MTHYELFKQMLGDVQLPGISSEAAIVSNEGMVLVSNIDDPHRESHLAAYASVFMKYGNCMMQIPGKKEFLPVEISLNVTANEFVLVTRLDHQLILVVQATDRQSIAPLMKQCLAQIGRIQSLSTSSL